jgi:hypothetical protein
LWYLSVVGSPAAQAHPFGDRYAAQRVLMDLGRERIVVHYTADAPPGMLVDDAADLEGALDMLERGLVLSVDGTTVPLARRTGTHRPDLVSMHTHLFDLVLVAEVDLAGRHTIELGNANLGGQPCYFYDDVRVVGSAWVHEASLQVARRDGELIDLSAAWTRSELRRRIRVEVELPDDPWSATFDRIDGRIHPLATMPNRPLAAAWVAGRTTPGTVFGAALALLLAGLAAGSGGRWLRAGAVLGLLLAGAFHAWSPVPWPAGPAAALTLLLLLGPEGSVWALLGAVGLTALPLALPEPWRILGGAALLGGMALGALARPGPLPRTALGVVATSALLWWASAG